MVELVHPPMLLDGGATPTSGAMPTLPSSVAPSGMVPDSAPTLAEGDDSPVPLAAAPGDVVAQPTDPIPLIPPPSKLKLVPDDVAPDVPAMPGDDVPELQAGDIAGPRPPGLISVAPSPIPAVDPIKPVEPFDPFKPIVPLAPGTPSGDTDRIAGAVGVVDMVCAAAAPQLNRRATATADNRRIETSRPAALMRDRSVAWISIANRCATKLVFRTINLSSRSDYVRSRLRKLLRLAFTCA
jgi:hypothetical protein